MMDGGIRYCPECDTFYRAGAVPLEDEGMAEITRGDFERLEHKLDLVMCWINGNGHPESGVLYRLKDVEDWRAEKEKEECEQKQDLKDVLKPLVGEVVKLVAMGLVVFLATKWV